MMQQRQKSPINIVGLRIQQYPNNDQSTSPVDVYKVTMFNDVLDFSLLLDAVVVVPEEAKYIYSTVTAYDMVNPSFVPIVIGSSSVPPLKGTTRQTVSLEFPFRIERDKLSFFGDDSVELEVILVWSNKPTGHQGGPDFLADVFFETHLEVVYEQAK
ncbi:hypothetical protein [Schleiferilactobacillus harbinensis]|uniref:Uncharacterized protein n=1 Tax=Schleiferilactobacillus harbinensis TaxID=304207 RepID=A0A5P8M3F1_9LACO|nr:hypothetical protein [Schleiferilactobacillus harbinensis]QFR22973.1 hypothetical protein D1010_05685 [Schleiferilactobacillus harbinensis]